MKMQDAIEIINKEPPGYYVCFHRREIDKFTPDYFPSHTDGEPLIKTEDEAWELATKFAKKTRGEAHNIYVVDDQFNPVEGWNDRKMNVR